MEPLGPSEWLWKEGTGYYNEQEADLLREPYLPNERFVPDRLVMRLFSEHGGFTHPRPQVLEIGCGRSPWLPYLAQTAGCRPVGLDLEPYAAQLARANLAGAGVKGDIYCRDAFDLQSNEDLWGRFDLVYSLGVMEHLSDVSAKIRVLARYVKPGGRIVTLVPNMQGVNWFLQRMGSLRVLQAHVVHTTDSLRMAHEQAGLKTMAAGYLGFVNGFLSSSLGERSKLRLTAHYGLCRMLAIMGAVWIRARLPLPEWRCVAPWVFYVGGQPAGAGNALTSDDLSAGRR
jgi:2-polyprenyl-6-hydroxyphenyl methylase/3-demethylubiquinone-9 3-methyltransferase